VGLTAYLNFSVDELLREDLSQLTQKTDYDTCWAARLTNEDGSLAYPYLLEELAERQHPDGSWGSQIPYIHDRFLSTLAVVLLLSRFGGRQRDDERRTAGERYIWQHVGQLHRVAHKPVGFEMILPTLLAEGRELGVDLPYAQLRHYEDVRAKKLSLLPTQRLFETQTSALFSLEAFAGDVDLEGATNLLLEDGSMAASPSATAFLMSQTPDWRARCPKSAAYLEDLLARQGGGLPMIAPCDTFVRAWVIYYLHHSSSLLAGHADSLKPHYEYFREQWRPEGVGWTPRTIPDADDTALVLLALRHAGYEVDGRGLLAYERDQHFVNFDFELDPSITTNLHILEVLETLPERERPRVRDKILNYVLGARWYDTFWSDKWHASVYYPTSMALMILPSHVPDEMDATLSWLLFTQHANGAWGQYMPTREETALTLLALLNYHRTVRPLAQESLRRAAEYLIATERPLGKSYPELWMCKALYAPGFIIRSIVLAALGLYHDTFGDLE
jgi:halimadienyl-diphosphate synthase